MKKKTNNLLVPKKEIEILKKEANEFPSWHLTDRQICDIELLLNGGFGPLSGFMNKDDYESVLKNMRLSDGSLWPIPIVLDVTDEFAEQIKNKKKITLRDKEGFCLAIMHVEDIWKPDLKNEAQNTYNTIDTDHPAVNFLLNISHKNYIGGNLIGISLPRHYDYLNLRHTPDELKSIFKNKNWNKIIAFQTRNPLHRAHFEMTKQALKDFNGKLLIHPVIGMTKPGDIDHYTRVRCYKKVLKKYSENTAMLSLLPLAMRMGGPREALWHALIRKNYGCSHLVIGRDHAGPGNDKFGNSFYEPYEAHDLLMQFKDEIGIEVVPFKFMVYLPKSNSYKTIDDVKENESYKSISGTELRNLLDDGIGVPDWFTFSEVAKELEISRPPRSERGLTIFFTGLSGSGKSTLANGLFIKLMEEGSRPVTLLDGDIVRKNLSSELGFSKKHRSINVQRIGYVASEITKNGGIAICAPIAPYSSDRLHNRNIISNLGGYVEIYVNTSLEKCEERDSKGLYDLARKGIIKEFTGVSDPYEEPKNPEITVNSSGTSPEKLIEKIYKNITEMGYIKS